MMENAIFTSIRTMFFIFFINNMFFNSFFYIKILHYERSIMYKITILYILICNFI
jgi:hypothetical protein